MKVDAVVRKSFGQGEFVEYPRTVLNRDWGDVEVFKHVDKHEGLTLQGVLLETRGDYGIFSCGGLLACCKNDKDLTRIQISVVPRPLEMQRV